jgi:hypothetical protein
VLSLEFEGWFMCRLATDPDPCDEPRGVSGWTFAVAGEPDLDRVVRFHDAPVTRSHAPPVGVTVQRVKVDGREVAEHPLLGGHLELLEDPKFEGRNGLVSEDGLEPILPFHLRISGDGMSLQRRDSLDPEDRPIHEVEPALLLRQFEEAAPPPAPQEVLAAIGVPDPGHAARERLTELRIKLTQAADDVERTALAKRVASLRPILARAVISYGFRIGALGGSGKVEGDPAHAAGLDVDAPWVFRAWMSAWDADALCGYTRGRLEVPARRR